MRIIVEDTCRSCNGAGHFMVQGTYFSGSSTCPSCQGTRVTRQSISLEDFAKLFTYGQTFGSNEHGPTVENEIRVRAPSRGTGTP